MISFLPVFVVGTVGLLVLNASPLNTPITMAEKKLLTIEEVNALDYDSFNKILGNVIEHCPLCVSAISKKRPFQTVRHLHQSIATFLDGLSDDGKEGVLRLHPDLAGRLAEMGKLTKESVEEQKAAGLDNMTEEERGILQRSNPLYKEKFGFPFVICARENKKGAIIVDIVKRLSNSIEEERKIGIEEVKKICRLRILNIVVDDNSTTSSLKE